MAKIPPKINTSDGARRSRSNVLQRFVVATLPLIRKSTAEDSRRSPGDGPLATRPDRRPEVDGYPFTSGVMDAS